MRRTATNLLSILAIAGLVAGACGSGKEEKSLTPEQRDAIARAAGKPTAGQPASTLFSRLGASGSRAAELVRQSTAAVYESPYKRARKEVENRLLTDFNTSAQPARVTFQDIDWLAALPAPADEVPGVRIGWYLNSAVAALQAGIEQNKPLVLFIGDTSCDFCKDLALVVRCSAVDRFAGEAVFAFSIPSRDLGAAAIAGSLNITADPSITILEPEVRMLIERGRINGFWDATPLGGHLDTVLFKTAPRSYAEFDPTAIVSLAKPRATRAPTAQEAEAAAKQRGLVHGPPAPVCK